MSSRPDNQPAATSSPPHTPLPDPKWLLIWSLIYLTFLLLDLLLPTFPGASLLKYVGIFLCLIYAYHAAKKDHLLVLALLMTFLADTILIWTHQFVFGIFVFCFAHFFHITRLTRTAPRFLIFYYLIVVSIFLFALLQNISPIYAIAIVYAMSLATNIILALRWLHLDRTNPRALAAALGFLLFLACDIFVAVQFLSAQGVFASTLYPLSTYLIWLFYLPSQILISHSTTT